MRGGFIKSSKPKTTAKSGKVCRIFGYVIGSFMAFSLILSIVDGVPSDYSIGYDIFMYLTWFSLSVVLIFIGFARKRRVRRLNVYIQLISDNDMTSLQKIAASTNQSIDFTKKDLQRLIDKKYFCDAYIDVIKSEIIFRKESTISKEPTIQNSVINTRVSTTEAKRIRCQSCGALLTTNDKSIMCEFCGSPL